MGRQFNLVKEVFGMSNYNNRVTILSPTYLSGEKHPQTGFHTHAKKKHWYKRVINSFYNSMSKPYPLHIFKDDSSQKEHKALEDFLKSIDANYKFLGGEKTNGYTALIKLICRN